MRLPNPLLLGAIYGLSELYLVVTRRSRAQAVSHDRRSIILLWTVIAVSLWLGIQMIWLFPSTTVPYPRGFYFFGFILFLGGLALRGIRSVISVATLRSTCRSQPNTS